MFPIEFRGGLACLSASANFVVKSIISFHLFPDLWRFRGKLNAPSLPRTRTQTQQTCRPTSIAARRYLMRHTQTHKSKLRQYLGSFKQAGKLVETHANFAVRLSRASLVNLATRMKSSVSHPNDTNCSPPSSQGVLWML